MSNPSYQEDRPIIKIIADYISGANDQKRKTILFERKDGSGKVFYDGKLIDNFPARLYTAFTSRIRILADMTISRNNPLEEGRISHDNLGNWDVLSMIADGSEVIELNAA